MSNQVNSPFGIYFKNLIFGGILGAIFGGTCSYFFGEWFGINFIQGALITGGAVVLGKVGGDIWNTAFK